MFIILFGSLNCSKESRHKTKAFYTLRPGNLEQPFVKSCNAMTSVEAFRPRAPTIQDAERIEKKRDINDRADQALEDLISDYEAGKPISWTNACQAHGLHEGTWLKGLKRKFTAIYPDFSIYEWNKNITDQP
jgi:hypothetical protein